MDNNGCGCAASCLPFLLVLTISFPIIIVMLIINGVSKDMDEKAKREKEEQERAAEAERRSKTKCHICDQPSDGDIICDSCFNCSQVIKKELPFNKTKDYDKINEFYEEQMLKAIKAEKETERESAFLKLLALEDILDEKYEKSKWNKTISFFDEVKSTTNKEQLVKKYNLKEHCDSKENEYDPNYKRYKCEDGDIVRSKGEREIDNFLYRNNIDHQYETFYKHPVRNKITRPDFYLPKYNLYIEYFGRYGDPSYDKNREEKIPMYQSDYSINFEYLTYEDDYNVTEKLESICRKYSIPYK